MSKIVYFPILFAFTFIHATVANQVQQPTVSYVVPPLFCKNLAPGNYCDPSFPRSYVNCPASQAQFCRANEICSNAGDTGKVKCVPDLWNPITQVCLDKQPGTSYCYGNMTVNCPNGDTFLCPNDLVCERRGRRAYCVQPRFYQNEPVGGFCNGVTKQNRTVCHPTNLKKIISCPGEKVEYCGGSNMCDVPNGTDQACCVPFRSNLQRWCSNKPLYSSYCLKDRDENQIVLCSQTPQILDCPEGSTRCLQDLSIKARCA